MPKSSPPFLHTFLLNYALPDRARKLGLGVLISALSSSAAFAATVDNSYTENQGKIAIDHNFAAFTGSDYSGGSLATTISNSTAHDKLTLAADANTSTTSGELSVVGNQVFLGDGSTAIPVGSVDSTNNGDSGKSLQVNFSAGFENANYEVGSNGDTSIQGWTNVLSQVITGQTVIAGQVVPLDTVYPTTGDDSCSNIGPRNQDKNTPNSLGTLSVQLTTAEIRAGSEGAAAQLSSTNVSTQVGCDIVRGPAIYSNSLVTVEAGDTIAFDWRAKGGQDAYDVYGYIIDVNDANKFQILLNQTGQNTNATNWQTASATIAQAGTYRFVFVAGTYDYSGGTSAGAQLFMDSYRIARKNPAPVLTAANIQTLAQKLRYENNNDNINTTTRTLAITATDKNAAQISSPANIVISAVNDDPVISGVNAKSLLESQTQVADYNATDAENDSLTFSVTGTDASVFTINKAGLLTFKSVPSFSSPSDSDSNNQYQVNVVVTDDGSPAASDSIAVTVTVQQDSDKDGVANSVETSQGTDPFDQQDYQDTDNDGVPDALDDNGNIDDDSGNGLANYFIEYPQSFQCDGDYFISQRDTLFHLDTTKTPFAFNDVAPAGFRGKQLINSIGFNYQDGYYYATRNSRSNEILRIEASGNVRNMGAVTGLPRSHYIRGDFDLKGTYYIATNRRLHRINLETMTATTHWLHGYFAPPDFAFNVRDGHLYGAQNNRLYKLDTTTYEVTSQVIKNLPSSGYGSAWFDAAGRFFFSSNQTGNIFRVDDFNNPVANHVSKGMPTSINDGASCAGSPILEHTISPASTSPLQEVTHTYTIDNGLPSTEPLGNNLSFNFADSLSDGRTFVADSLTITGAANSPTINSYAGGASLTIDNIELAPVSQLVVTVKVKIPANLGGTYYNQAKLTGVARYLGGPEILSDNPGGTRPDATPLVVVSGSANNTFTGAVYNDLNRNGSRDRGEPGVAGVKVKLDSANEINTDGDGNYQFSALTDNNYIARIELPSGFTLVGPNPLNKVALAGGNTAANNDFAIFSKASIIGTVYNDIDGNKRRDADDEPGIKDVTVNLINFVNNQKRIIATTTTIDGGFYSFEQLNGGLYYVEQIDDSAYSSVSDNLVEVNLLSGRQVKKDFADMLKGTISGRVFDDANGNGIQDTGEDPLVGVSVSITERGAKNPLESKTTDELGAYSFSVAANKSYIVKESDPVGFNSITSNERTTSVGVGGAAVANFADIKQSVISGVAFEDLNGNKVQDLEELGLSGIKITLNNGAPITTGPGGRYQFNNVTAGTYDVASAKPNNFVHASADIQKVTILQGQSNTANFAFVATNSVSGTVFIDYDANGEQGANEAGVSGVLVELSNGLFTHTGDDGRYEFANVVVGKYDLAITAPDGFSATTGVKKEITLTGSNAATQGFGLRPDGVISGIAFNDLNGDGSLNSNEQGLGDVEVKLDDGNPVDTTIDGSFKYAFLTATEKTVSAAVPTGFAATTKLSQGKTPSASVNFGFVQLGSISGVVFSDANGNGVQDSGEAGLSGATVSISGADTGSTKTDGAGNYTFTNLTGGSETLSASYNSDYFNINENPHKLTLTDKAVYNFALQENIAPVANNDVATVVEDSANNEIDALNNDTDANGDTLTITLASASNGRAAIVNNKISYTPNGDFSGRASISYTISDGRGATNSGTITVTVAGVSDAPTANRQRLSTVEETAVPITLTGNDVDGDSLTFSVQTGPANGTVSGSGANITYTPVKDFFGTDNFTFVANDGNNDSAPATVTIEVSNVNDAPTAQGQSVELTENTRESITLTGSDVDGDSLTYLVATPPTNGTLTGSGATLTYQPNQDYIGEDSFTFTVNDGQLASDQARVSITVNAANNAPQALDDSVTVEQNSIDNPVNVLANDSDIDGDELVVSSAAANHGHVVILANGALNYTPEQSFHGEDTIAYSISDGKGGSASASVKVTVSEKPVNKAPIAVDDSVTISTINTTTIDVLANDSDPENDELSVVSASSDFGNTQVVNQQVQFTPYQGVSGLLVVNYSIEDSAGNTASAQVLVDFDNTLAPEITLPQDLCGEFTVNANALYTRVELGQASAVDRFGNTVPVSLVDGISLFPPGLNEAAWQATDSEGNTRIAVQKVCVLPLVSLAKDQITSEGQSLTIGVHLNGNAPVYPMVVPYTVSGTANSDDHNLVSGELVIEQGTDASIAVKITEDGNSEGDETLVVSLDSSVNLGDKSTHTITISDGNIAPQVTLNVSQQAQERLLITADGGEVVIRTSVTDANVADEHSYQWQINDASVTNTSTNPDIFSFDPTQLAAGLYRIDVEVTDNGVPAKSASSFVYIELVGQLPELTDADTDGDLIPDNQEGFGDSDADGIADYLDATPECNVLPEQAIVTNAYLVEGQAGVCLRRGEFTLMGETGGAQITDNDVANEGDQLTQDTEATNIGGIFDYIAYGLPVQGSSYAIVMPQRNPVPENPVYRKFNLAQGWHNFIEDANNSLWSTAGEPGYCPPPAVDNNSVWTPGLTPGHWCVQMVIEDGGVNDDDGEANGTVVDPGYVGVLKTANQLPVAEDDSETLLVNSEITLDVLANDSDADGDVLTISSATANIGEVSIVDEQLHFTPPPNYNGDVVIIYGITDSQGGTAQAEVTLSIIPNNAPQVSGEQSEMNQGEELTINLLENDTDPEGDTLTLVRVEVNAEQGQVNFNSNGQASFTPAANFSGAVLINYIVEDTVGNQSQGQWQIKVVPLTQIQAQTKGGGSVNLWMLLLLVLLTARLKWQAKG
ncbi:tandem-95 repeat protein [Thalassotalea euphylliae]|uniref:Tandem-95 repeat protein n=1 Tax=Thalassotalea euphylliae TaxID=1655234 RepID=A0A3E0TTZ3_9GAMM|nr:Ig-like domain-containing protein [Thalassotalea euphylliae]REL28146.1 tandem-95 repeat protein [Thalassotalea euphylliae]